MQVVKLLINENLPNGSSHVSHVGYCKSWLRTKTRLGWNNQHEIKLSTAKNYTWQDTDLTKKKKKTTEEESSLLKMKPAKLVPESWTW